MVRKFWHECFAVHLSYHTSEIEITACPIGTTKHFFTGFHPQDIVTNVFCGCFDTGGFENITRFLINKSMDRTGSRFSFHPDFVILTSSLNVKLILGSIIPTNLTMVVRLEVLQETIAEHQAILTNVELNRILSIFLSSVVSERLGGHVGKPLNITNISRISARVKGSVPVQELDHFFFRGFLFGFSGGFSDGSLYRTSTFSRGFFTLSYCFCMCS